MRAAWIAAGIWGLLLVGWCLVQPPQVQPDSVSYLGHSPERPFVYPLLLDLFKSVSGGAPGRPLGMMQALFGLFCARNLVSALQARFRFGCWAWLMLFIVASAPQWQWALIVMPDSLAFSVFLWFMARLVDAVATRSTTAIVTTGALAALAVHLRPQYLFVYPPLALVLIGLLVSSRLRQRVTVAVLSAILAVAGTHLGQRAYNAVVHRSFAGISMTGLQMLTVQLYLMAPGDVQGIPDPGDRRYLEDALKRMEGPAAVAKEACVTSDPFANSYNAICWGAAVPAFGIPPTMAGRAAAGPWIELDRVSTRIALELIEAHPVRYLAHMATAIYRSERYMAAIVFLEILVGGVLALRTRRVTWLVVALTGLFAGSNLILVAMVEPLVFRYTFPTDTVALVVAVALWLAPQGAALEAM
jgi:hypothetical protein